MPLRLGLLACFAACLSSCSRGEAAPTTPSAEDAPPVAWRGWEAEAFEQAQSEQKYLLVSVQAAWCHWCHVMNDETFGNARIRQLLADRYVAIKVDSDDRPDLAERFQDYAWPATVLLTPDAQMVIGVRGYRSPEDFAPMLEQVASGQMPVDTAAEDDGPPPELDALRIAARERMDQLFDEDAAGWGQRQKYPYFAPVEHSYFRALVLGEDDWRDRALRTLEGTADLIDPVFGGVYQYSLRGGWTHPHYEKIAAVQADALAGFATAALYDPDPRWLERAERVRAYIAEFMTDPDGGFYTSQDADLSHDVTGTQYYAMQDAERRALGFPRVDPHLYTDLNGRMIEALVRLHRADPSKGALQMAMRAADRMEPRREEDGGFRHDDAQEPLRFLRDQAWMLRAELALHEATGQPRFEEAAVRTATFVMEQLGSPEGGFFAHTEDPAAVGVFAERRVPVVENGVLARGLLHLARIKADESYRAAAESAVQSVSVREVRRSGRRAGDLLIALEQMVAPYVLVSVVGPDDEPTQALHNAAFRMPVINRLVELGRPGESRYPFPGEPAAFMCNQDSCSRPMFEPEAVAEAARGFLGR